MRFELGLLNLRLFELDDKDEKRQIKITFWNFINNFP